MERINRLPTLLPAVALMLVVVAPAAWTCERIDDCDYAPNLKDFIRLACDSGPGCDGDHHIAIRGLIKLACDDPSGCEDCRKDLKGLLQLACADPSECDDFRKDLKGLQKLACADPEDCTDYKPNLDQVLKLACDAQDCEDYKPDLRGLNRVAYAPKKKLTFMAVPKSVRPSTTLKDDHLSQPITSPPATSKAKPTPEAQAMERIEQADPNDFPEIMAFLNKRIPVDAKDTNGNTLLFYMSAKGDASAVKYLLDKGADPQCKNKKGCTPLSCAKAKGHKKIEKLMMLADKDEEGHLGSDRVPVGTPEDK